MLGTHLSINGKLTEVEKVVLPIDHIEFAYGFGVYENIRLRNGALYFANKHIDRLFDSAQMINLEHAYTKNDVQHAIVDLINQNGIESCNIKILLVGGNEPLLYIFELAPKFVEKKLYKTGVSVITKQYERFLPQAKTLNMLPSYMIYKEAMSNGAYDALLYDTNNIIHEGTRSNIFFIKDRQLYTPPDEYVLKGVTRETVIECAETNGYTVIKKDILLNEIMNFDGAFVTNTSGKIVPIKQIDNETYPSIPKALQELMSLYNTFITQHANQIL